MWHDAYDPTEVLTRCGFGELAKAEVESVLAVDFSGPGGEELRIKYRCSAPDASEASFDTALCLLQGGIALAKLREAMRAVFQVPGNAHWGTAMDIACLAEAMNMGFLVFSNVPQGGNRWLYSLGLQRGNYPYWLVLYCADTTHFQLGNLRNVDSVSGRSAFAEAQVPQLFRGHYDPCNARAPFGPTARGSLIEEATKRS